MCSLRFVRSWPLLALVTALFVLQPWQAPRLNAESMEAFDTRFGAVEAFRANVQADAAGVRWTRLAFWWSGLQPDGATSWNAFYFPDELLEAELSSGRRVVGLLMNTPGWAGDGSPHDPPRGLDLPLDHPDNTWATFTRQMAERYRGRIEHWVLWNEPDIWDPASPTYTWNGSLEQFYRLQKVGYLAIKQVNPEARVSLAGLTYWWDYFYQRQQYFERFLELGDRDPQAAVHGYFFDAAVLHLYNEPEGLYRAPTLFRTLMAQRSLSKPIWINETNVAPWNDPINPMPRADFRATLDEQASYIIQAFAWGLVGGAEHISVYPFSDGEAPPGSEMMGMVRGDGSARPAYRALQTATRYFAGVRDARARRDGDAVVIVLQREGGTVTVAWSQAPRPATVAIPARSSSALLVDKFGVQTPITPRDGAYQLVLDPATANTINGEPNRYYIGGNPQLLVEDPSLRLTN
jgi:hypothetical protein